MEKSVFNLKLKNLDRYSLSEKSDIQMEKNHYPYCALLQCMDLLSDKALSIPSWDSRTLPRVVQYLNNDISKLNHFLDIVSMVENTSDPTSSVEAPSPAESPASNEDFDIMKEINSYQEVSFKTAPKSVILSKFLETSNYNPDELGDASDVSIDVLGKNSIRNDQSLETETLAIVFEKQGKFDQAVAIYEKLISRIPEKSSIFASRIQELKSKSERK